jgi:hypothetical protein
MSVKPLGRRVPSDFEHVEKYPFGAVAPQTVQVVEHVLLLPTWHWTHDQGMEGSCVPHGGSMERSITNTAQNKLLRIFRGGRRYDPLWAWDEAKKIDEWADTNPGDDNGTSVRAFYDVMRLQGHRRITSNGITVSNGKPVLTKPSALPNPSEGVLTNRWARTVDEMRTALADGIPVAIGVNWYHAFDTPQPYPSRKSEWWIAYNAPDLGQIRGGHCVCIYGASDKRQAFRVKNSWGRDYPLVWLPYSVMQRLLDEDGEAALVTDR